MIKKKDTVRIVRGMHQGMVGKVTTVKLFRGKMRAVVFFNDTLRTITVPMSYVEKLS